MLPCHMNIGLGNKLRPLPLGASNPRDTAQLRAGPEMKQDCGEDSSDGEGHKSLVNYGDFGHFMSVFVEKLTKIVKRPL